MIQSLSDGNIAMMGANGIFLNLHHCGNLFVVASFNREI